MLGDKKKLFSGILIVLTVLLGFIHSEYWFYFTGIIGLRLILMYYTDFCPIGTPLKAVFGKNKNKSKSA